MTVENPGPPTDAGTTQAPSLEDFLLTILEQYDGLCLDNQPERVELATALAAALISPAGNDTVNNTPPTD